MSAQPMFPLGTALLPGEVLPLRIFEPRYRTMLDDCLAVADGPPRFGVVLIARGSEVGGGDVRHDVGTFAAIDRVSRDPGGLSYVHCVGTRRFRVTEWLPDDPYPRAEVSVLNEPKTTATARADSLALGARIREIVVDAYTRRGTPIPDDLPSFDDADFDDAGLFGWAARLPIGAADRQSLLEAPDTPARIAILDDAVEGFAARIAFDS